jgi:DNA-directed RNA polymerase specialized sigma24 family protein
VSFSQDPQPTFVLDSRRTRLDAMNVAAPNLEAERPENRSSDEELMAAFPRGSMDAFSELFSRYKQPLFGFFRRRLTDPEQAEELTQETFLAVLRASSRYHPSALFRTYLYAIGFKILRVHRRKAVFRATFLGTTGGSPEAAVHDTATAELMLRQAASWNAWSGRF